MPRTPQKPAKKSLLAVLLSRLGKQSHEEPPPAQQLRPFQAISIYRGLISCDTARKFSEHRYLAKDAPPLPLAGCTMKERCQCRYLKYKDRRSGSRRLVEFGMSARIFDGSERRRAGGRRKTD